MSIAPPIPDLVARLNAELTAPAIRALRAAWAYEMRDLD
jgi:hypothetical protein